MSSMAGTLGLLSRTRKEDRRGEERWGGGGEEGKGNGERIDKGWGAKEREEDAKWKERERD